MSTELKTEAELTCDQCGKYGAMDFDAKKLCPDCYGTSCSCCPEFGQEEEAERDENKKGEA